jgi:hypothetical protein
MLIARAVPKENAIVHGLADGARAAKDMVEDWRWGRTSTETEPASTS